MGHLHTCKLSATRPCIPEECLPDVQIYSPNYELGGVRNGNAFVARTQNAVSGDLDSSELALGDRDFEGWDDVESEDSESGGYEDFAEDEDFTGM